MIAQSDFPNDITFKLSASALSSIEKVELRLTEPSKSCGSPYYFTQPKFKPGKNISAIYVRPASIREPLVPGTNFEYFWRIITNDGTTLKTSTISLIIQDNRYVWNELHQDNLRLYWYEGDEDFGRTLLRSSQESISTLQQVFGSEIEGEIKIYVYKDANDLHAALFEPTEWTGGVAFIDRRTIVIAIPPDAVDWGEIAIAHEAAHLINRQVSFSCSSLIPNWLDEGIATIAEGGPSLTDEELRHSVENGRYFSAGVLTFDFPSDPEAAELAYAQSYSMANYLINEFGLEKLHELFEAFKASSVFTTAFRRTYGFDLQEFEHRWRRNLLME